MHGGALAADTYVFLHGLGASHEQFDFVHKSAPQSACLLMVDLPYHGENTAAPEAGLSFDDFAELVLALCDHLNIKHARFVGVSMGGGLALMCALRRPELVEHLVIIRPSWLASACPPHLALIERCGAWLDQYDPAEALAQLERDTAYQELLQDVPLAAASVQGVFLRPHATAHAPVLGAMFNDCPFASLNELRAVQVPATVIGTHADSLHPVSIANATANALPNGTLKILPPRYLRPKDHANALADTIFDRTGAAA